MEETKTIKFPAVTITEEEFDKKIAKAIDAMMKECNEKKGPSEMGLMMGLTSMMFGHELKQLLFEDTTGGGCSEE